MTEKPTDNRDKMRSTRRALRRGTTPWPVIQRMDGWVPRARIMEDMMWAEFLKRWLDLCFWWLPMPKGEGESAADTDRTHTVTENASTDLMASEREAGEDHRSADADDLTVIKGIGSGTQRKLITFGIKTLADLAASDPEKLYAKLSASLPISEARVKRWIKEAQDRTVSRT